MHGRVVCVLTLCIVSVSSQLLQNIPADFQPILSKIISESKSKVKIAKASDTLEVKGHKAIARVIKHANSDSRFARTVIIQNSPEAYRAFGVRNAPNKLFVRSEKETDDTSFLKSNLEVISKKSDVPDFPREIKPDLMEMTPGQMEKHFVSKITLKEDNERSVKIDEINVQENHTSANITNLPTQKGIFFNIQKTPEVNQFHSQKDTVTSDMTSTSKRILGNDKAIIKNMSTTLPDIPRRVRSYSTSNKQNRTNGIELQGGKKSVQQSNESELDRTIDEISIKQFISIVTNSHTVRNSVESKELLRGCELQAILSVRCVPLPIQPNNTRKN